MQSTALAAVAAVRPLASARPWEAVVVGGAFAGLSAARAAAGAGLRVLVLDRQRGPGHRLATTGLLAPDAVEALRPPAAVLGPRLDALRLAGPELRPGPRLERPGAGFTPTDTPGLLRELAARAEQAGAELRWGQAVRGVERRGAELLVHAADGRCRAERVVGADGARSVTARSVGLRPARGLLVGIERHFEPEATGELEPDAALLVLSGRWAPGYAAWALPGFGGRWQVGLLARPGAGHHPGRALDDFCAALERRCGARWGRPRELRAGWVPVGGPTRRPVAGRTALVGDAAGQVSELTAGGIGRAVRAGEALGARLAEGPPAWREEARRAAADCGGARPGLRQALRLVTRPGLDLLFARAAGLPFARPFLEELLFRPLPAASVRETGLA